MAGTVANAIDKEKVLARSNMICGVRFIKNFK